MSMKIRDKVFLLTPFFSAFNLFGQAVRVIDAGDEGNVNLAIEAVLVLLVGMKIQMLLAAWCL